MDDDPIWLDVDFASDDGAGRRWRVVLDRLRRDAPKRLAVVVLLDVDLLLRGDESELRAAAGNIRRCLRRIHEAAAASSVHLLIDGIDRLYGLRSAVQTMHADRLVRPLGSFRADGEAVIQFVNKTLADAAEALVPRRPPSAPDQAAAASQAVDEFLRLRSPLATFCADVFGSGKDYDLGGIFFGSTGPEGETAPSLLSALPNITLVAEPPLPARSWFWSDLLSEELPAAIRPARSAPGRTVIPAARAGLSGLLCGTLALCALLTWSFVESRSLLLAAAGRIEPPQSPERLEPLRQLATLAHSRNREWRLPRFGMHEAETLEREIKHRFIDGYFDLKTIPHLETIQDTAVAAADSRDPALIGRILIRLMITRDGLTRAVDHDGGDSDTRYFLTSMAEILDLVSPEDMRQLDTFYAWAVERDWMPATRDALVEFERYVLDKTAGGSLAWLVPWVEGLPGIRPVNAAGGALTAPPYGDSGEIPAAWTADAYAIIRAFLDAVVYDQDNPGLWRARRDAFLADYRREALERWQRVAGSLWNGFHNVRDGDVSRLLRRAMRGDDPAARFLALARKHLLPIFDDDDPDPDIAWLRLHCQMFETSAQGDAMGPAARFVAAIRRIGALAESSEATLAAVRHQFRRRAGDGPSLPVASDDPFFEAGEAAEELHRHLTDATGGSWGGVSPRAVYAHLRRLAVHQAALELDALWRETVYNPLHTLPGREADRDRALARSLNAFLNGPALGFWRLDGDAVAAAAWDRVDCMLSPEFFAFANRVIAAGGGPGADVVRLPFVLEAVSVDSSAAERPLFTEITLRRGEAEEKVVYRNFAQTEVFTWRSGDETVVEVDVVFSSFRLHRRFTGDDSVAQFVRLFESGSWTLYPSDFPASAENLARIGVDDIVIKGSFGNQDELKRAMARTLPAPPRSIVSRVVDGDGNIDGENRGGPKDGAPAAGMIARAAWTRE